MAHKKNRISHKKEIYYILCIVSFLGILLLSFLGPGGYRELQKTRLELHERRVRIEKIRKENRERTRAIEALRSDKNALEEHARRNGYVRRDESIQMIPPESDEIPK